MLSTTYHSGFLVILFSRFILGSPFVSTTTASPPVSQISDGQVQAAAGTRSGADFSPSSVPISDHPISETSVLTFKATNSIGSLTTGTTTASNVVITSLLEGQTLLGLPTTNSEGLLIMSTTTIYPETTLMSQVTTGGSTAEAAVETADGPRASNEGQTTRADLETETPMALDTSSETIQATGAQASDSSLSSTHHRPSIATRLTRGSASGPSGPETAEPLANPTSDITMDVPQDTSDLVAPGSSTPLSSQAQDTPKSGEQSSSQAQQDLDNASKSSSPQTQSELESITPTSANTSPDTSAPGGSSPINSDDIPDSQIPSAQSTESVMNESKGPLEAPAPNIATVADTPASQSAEITLTSPSWVALPSQGSSGLPAVPLPATTEAASIDPSLRLGDSITTQIIDSQGYPVPAIMVVTADAEGSTSARLASLLPLPSVQTEFEPTSTMTTTPPGFSIEEVANPLWVSNTWTTTTPPGGSEPTPPEIITDSPQPGDTQPPGPDDEQSSTASKDPEESTTKPSSTITSSAATTICNMPSLKGVVHRDVDATYLLPPRTGPREIPEYTAYTEIASTMPSSVMSSPLAPAPTTSNPAQTTDRSGPASSSPPQVEDSPDPPEGDSSPQPLDDGPRTKSVNAIDPPDGPTCNPAPSGSYEDSSEYEVQQLAQVFCDEHKDRIFHSNDEEISKTFEGITSDDWKISVKWWGQECESPGGNRVGNPYGYEDDVCYELLTRAWKE
ncbi:MAG: hypothetical protein Q9169_006392, partial [Polycauliona sp. 2 TL-2023]